MNEVESSTDSREATPLPPWIDIVALTRIFKVSVVVSVTTFLLLWFELYLMGSFLSLETWDALAWGGYGALLPWPPSFPWLKMLLWVAAAIGMYSFSASARLLYLILFLFDLTITTLSSGISVNTAWGGFLADLTTFSDGIVLTLAYLSPLRTRFR